MGKTTNSRGRDPNLCRFPWSPKKNMYLGDSHPSISAKVYRAKVGNISMKSSKTDLADFFKQHFADVKSTDFQPRYSEHGMMFGYARCLCCSSYPVDLSCLKQKKVCWTAFSCPEVSSTVTRSRSRERTTRQASPHPYLPLCTSISLDHHHHYKCSWTYDARGSQDLRRILLHLPFPIP